MTSSSRSSRSTFSAS